MQIQQARRKGLKLMFALVLLCALYVRPAVLHATIMCDGSVCCIDGTTDMCETYDQNGYCSFVCQAEGGSGGSALGCYAGTGQDLLCCQCNDMN